MTNEFQPATDNHTTEKNGDPEINLSKEGVSEYGGGEARESQEYEEEDEVDC